MPAPPQPAVPAPDPVAVADVSIDVTADNAAHARDQAFMQAQRAALVQLLGRLGLPDSSAKLSDDDVFLLVQSVEVQTEHVSTVRYLGVFTIRFKPAPIQKKFGKVLLAAGTQGAGGDPKPPPSHLATGVQTSSLAGWMEIKRRLGDMPQITQIDVIDLGRGVSHITLSYTGKINELQQALTAQGLVLRPTPAGDWSLYDGSMISR